MRNIVNLLLIVACSVSYIYGQESISGIVLSENKKGKFEPVPFANVYWQGTNYGTSTDSSGYFQLAIPEDAENLITSFVGFQTDTSFVEDFSKSVTISIKQSIELKEVTIDYRQKSSQMSFINPIQTVEMNEKELFKAACCNLSESFETNPSVDVNFTDAVTGAKQIRMLGLSGPYTLISRENMPAVRGLGNAHGLSFIPGTWINSIQVSKGVGSVVNGYESIAGQINVELQKPELGEQTFFNVYANAGSRSEVNLLHTEKLSEKLSTTTLLHGNFRPIENDVNKDGFRDFPLQSQFNFMNRWKYESGKGFNAQIGISYLNEDKEGGQTDQLVEEQSNKQADFSPYLLKIKTLKTELFGKVGYVFPEFKYKSLGFQWSAMVHEQNSFFGSRLYEARQQSGYANLIYQSIISNSFHQFKTGLSLIYDEYDEVFDSTNFDRVERIFGGFFEYTFKPSNNITLVAGARADHHNLYGAFITPRIHFRYAANETTVIRLLAGSGQRSPTVLADRQSLMASARSFEFLGMASNKPYGLEMERAWNYGFNLTKNFRLDYRDGVISIDFYRTEFKNQVVVDFDESSQRVLFYNLNGKSFSNSAQFQLDYELIKFLDLRLAYRWIQVETDFLSGLRQQVLTPQHRLFANVAYETERSLSGANWSIDFTVQWLSKQRLPTKKITPPDEPENIYSPSFTVFNTQLTRNFNRRWAVYAGVENIFDFRQDNPIIDASNPFGNQFDASVVWGPVFGRMIYGGLRFRIQEKEE